MSPYVEGSASVLRLPPMALGAPLRRAGAWVLCVALAWGGVQWARAAMVHTLEDQAIETKAIGRETPWQFGVAFREMRLPLPDHTVAARIVHAADPAAPALLIFHGNGEALSDWSGVQAGLAKAGVTSMVFDYAGFGVSTGRPSVGGMREDALAAYAVLRRLTPAAGSHVLVGHSLGNAVMLDAAPLLRPAPTALVVHAAFTSAREFAVRSGLVNGLVAELMPDLWDNEAALAEPGPPVLVLHGAQDEVIPAAMGRKLAQAARGRAQFKLLARTGHDGFYLRPSAQEWDPVIAFATAVGAPQRVADAGH